MSREHDGLHYFFDPLPGHRAQAYYDIVVDGKVITTVKSGSPAPLETVKRGVEENNATLRHNKNRR